MLFQGDYFVQEKAEEHYKIDYDELDFLEKETERRLFEGLDEDIGKYYELFYGRFSRMIDSFFGGKKKKAFIEIHREFTQDYLRRNFYRCIEEKVAREIVDGELIF